MIAAGILEERLVADLLKEGKELTAILGAIAVSTKRSTVS